MVRPINSRHRHQERKSPRTFDGSGLRNHQRKATPKDISPGLPWRNSLSYPHVHVGVGPCLCPRSVHVGGGDAEILRLLISPAGVSRFDHLWVPQSIHRLRKSKRLPIRCRWEWSHGRRYKRYWLATPVLWVLEVRRGRS